MILAEGQVMVEITLLKRVLSYLPKYGATAPLLLSLLLRNF